MQRLFHLSLSWLFMSAAPAMADPLLGLWLTKPDHKGQVAHVQAAPCGTGICGTILRAFDRRGQPVVTPNVGKRVFWDMRPVVPGAYSGRGWLPLLKAEFDGAIEVRGDRLTVRGCVGLMCQSQVWTRVTD
ncbi:DUF2147 domain-containing protein [Thalassovita sp.]|uniref:DUF2147 domain-containing protein n=1 Tax=Thalassovita sp. TaxID=1979401 RepID=UPI0029DE70D3|nr:DUF2147 domain-containing protein [Thalassovita sp.]